MFRSHKYKSVTYKSIAFKSLVFGYHDILSQWVPPRVGEEKVTICTLSKGGARASPAIVPKSQLSYNFWGLVPIS